MKFMNQKTSNLSENINFAFSFDFFYYYNMTILKIKEVKNNENGGLKWINKDKP